MASGISHESIKRFGLSSVHTPVGQCTVDIVFVHGLNGHPYDTWTSEESKNFWPGQLLPLAVEEENPRILVYGYDADVTSFTDGVSKDKIQIAELSADRRRQSATERPIVFVAHSLGGLVIKRALVYSSEVRGIMTEHLRSIFVSTYGILFLGTPHAGSNVAEWGSRLESICSAILPTRLIDTQPQLVNALKANSETLQNIDRQFIQLTSQFRIYFFHEGKPTHLHGLLRYVVDEESASPNIQDVERACIQQDHSHMCKFEDDRAPGFQIVTEAIQRYSSQASDLIVSRWNTEKAALRKKKEAHAEEIYPRGLRRCEEDASSTSSLLGSSKISSQLFLVPFARDMFFVNRVDILDNINKYIKQYSRVALSGIGGVGKSQIAIEYCYRFRNDHPHAQVFWVHASTRQRFEQGYRDIARRLELPGWDLPNIDTLRLVSDWFNEPDKESYLLVLDNADDMDMFFAKSSSTATNNDSTLSLNGYLPRYSRGSMLITTRDERLSKRLAGVEASILVGPMSQKEAQKLLERFQIGPTQSSNIDQSQQLCEALGYIPLAIAQAAAFINENYITLTKYLDMFHASDSDLQDLLERDLGDPRRDPQSYNSVIRTWKLSFDLISKREPRAAEMLSLMALLDRQGIPESLLRNDSDREVEFTRALGTLQGFSLITAGASGAGYEMHRLVQLATQKWLEMQGTLKLWQEKALMAVSDIFPFGEFGDWTICASLLPHAQKVLEYGDANGLCPEEFGRLLYNVARFDSEQGRYEMAYVKYLAAVAVYKIHLGMNHFKTLDSMNNLAVVHGHLGRWEEAEKLDVQVLEGRKMLLGAEHPETLATMDNLAVTYASQGRFEKAEALQAQVFEKKIELLGAEHPDTLTCMNNLADTYHRQGRLEEAETLCMQVIERGTRMLGAKHPKILIYMENVAILYKKQNRHGEAVAFMEKVVELRKEALSANHPATIESVDRLRIWLGDSASSSSN